VYVFRSQSGQKCAGGWDSVLDRTDGAYYASRPLPGLRRREGREQAWKGKRQGRGG